MAKPTGFLEFDRQNLTYAPVEERVKHYKEFSIQLTDEDLNKQAARCMDCGIPFCHATGCPVVNRIPEFNDLVYQGRWEEASANLHSTNNFPEFTGRICPAPCEASCTLNINDDAVTIKNIEYQIVEKAYENGWVKPIIADKKTGKKVAIIGSGPSGMASAQQLARAGHDVTLFEKDEKIGGLMRYGIPDFKFEKNVIDRRMEQMEAEGVTFQSGVCVGKDISVRYLQKTFDAVLLCMGAGQPRDLPVEGRDADGVYFAMEFLGKNNQVVGGEITDAEQIRADGKNVIVIGGGDTGSDCVGTSIRHGANSVTQFELLPQPPDAKRNEATPWPLWPQIMRTSTSHKEGCERRWCINTRKLVKDADGNVSELHGVEVEWSKDERGAWKMTEKEGSEFVQKADLVLLAMGFVHVVHPGLVEDFGFELDHRGNIKVDKSCMTTKEGVFACGDAVDGASLVVRAIAKGRMAAHQIDKWLMGETTLPVR
ncbi:MAG: glutamate synthase subunit beta [Lentisphaeria bacterium]|nr:glutamate synthase subunit beta [Lentisphaeria bacterium]